MKLTIEEKKKWLKEHENEIREYAYRAAKEEDDMIKNLTPGFYSDETEKYAKIYFDKKINNYTKEQYDHKEEICGIDLKPYLEKIRNNIYESMIYLMIKDGKVVREQIHKGNLFNCNDEGGVYAGEMIKQAKELGCDIYFVHNHPLSIVAAPSGCLKTYGKDMKQEVGDYVCWHTIYPNMCKNAGIKMLDFAVVTPLDYFSLEQSGLKNSGPLVEEL